MEASRQLALFKGKRQRGVKARAPTEFALHCAVADLIRRWLRPQWIWTHFPSGEERPSEIVAGKRVSFAGQRLKRMGHHPGFPDFLFFCLDGRCAFLELKRRGGRLSAEQGAIAAVLERAGHAYLCADCFDDAVTWLIAQGIVRSGIHP